MVFGGMCGMGKVGDAACCVRTRERRFQQAILELHRIASKAGGRGIEDEYSDLCEKERGKRALLHSQDDLR